MASDLTSVQVSKKTRDQFKQLGRKGETYDQVVNRLIEIARKTKFFKDIDRTLETEEFVPLEEV